MHYKKQSVLGFIALFIVFGFYHLDSKMREKLTKDRLYAQEDFSRYHNLVYSLRDSIDLNKDFKTHIENRLLETSRGFLKRLADSASIDGQIIVWDRNCELVASSSLGFPLSHNCRVEHGTKKKWSLSKGLLMVSLPLPHLGLRLEVHSSKVSIFPRGHQHIKDLLRTDDILGTAAPLLVITPECILYSSRSLVNLWYGWGYFLPQNWPLLLASLLIVFLSLLAYKYFKGLLNKYTAASLMGEAIIKQQGMSLEPGTTLLGLFQIIEKKLVETQMEKHEQVRHLEGAVREQSTEISQLKTLQLHSYFYDSLQEQIQDYGQKLKEAIMQWNSISEDITDTIEKAIYPPCKESFKLLQSWRSELERATPRKFFRSLSERTHKSGLSQLDHDVHTLVNNLDTLFQNSIQLRLAMENQSKCQKSIAALSEYWLSLAAYEQGHSFVNITESTLNAQTLVMDQHSLDARVFINHWGDESWKLSVDPTSWKTCLLHIYRAILLGIDEIVRPIYTKSMHKDQRFFFIISYSFANEANRTSKVKFENQMVTARKMLASYSLQFINLSHDNEIAIAITWSSHDVISQQSYQDLSPHLNGS